MPTKALILQTQRDLYNCYEKYIGDRPRPFASWTRDFRDDDFLQVLLGFKTCDPLCTLPSYDFRYQ